MATILDAVSDVSRMNGTKVTDIGAHMAEKKRRALFDSLCDAAVQMARYQDCALLAHAERELPDAGDDAAQSLMNARLLALVSMFALCEFPNQFLAGYAAQSLAELVRGRPLTALTGADSEWLAFGATGRVEQNIRMPSVFRVDRSLAWWENGFIFREPATQYTSALSRRTITFPWAPCDPAVIAVPPDASEADMRCALQSRGFEPFEAPRIEMVGA